MIQLKTSEEIKIMQQGGKILRDVLTSVLQQVKVGIRLSDLDSFAELEIRKRRAVPSFQLVKGYKWSICGCVNDVVVHGIPDEYTIREGDVVGIDCGVYYKGFHTDASWTILVSNKKRQQPSDIKEFLSTGEHALDEAIQQVKEGNYIYDISLAIQKTLTKKGYSIVRTLVGHGVGRELHEEPEIPGYVHGPRSHSIKIRTGMVLAIEVIYNMGSADVTYRGDDGWTIVTKDGKISGLFESTVAVGSHGCIVLTEKPYDS